MPVTELPLSQSGKSALDVAASVSGEAGKLSHFKDAFKKGRADAALAAGLLHYGEINIADVKKCVPIYEEFDGWNNFNKKCKSFSELPNNTKKYIKLQ